MSEVGKRREVELEELAELDAHAFWLARDRAQAEDVVQEALLRSWRAFPRLREAAAAKAWLFAIVRNEHRRAAGAAGLPAESVDVAEIADERHELHGLEMRDALMALPPAYAEPLALQVLGGFSCGEIAELIGATEGATMTRLTRARQLLRRLVDPGGRKVAKP